MDLSSLTEAIQSLVRLDRAGLLEEFQIDVAEACRGPANDLERHVEWKWAIHRFSRLASRLFDVPAWQAEKATKAALLPSTRQGITLQILEQYVGRLDEEQLKAQAERSARQFNRRLQRA
jgi:hypothetical protein